MVTEAKTLLIPGPVGFELSKTLTRQQTGGSPAMQMGCPDALQRAHRAEGIGEMQDKGLCMAVQMLSFTGGGNLLRGQEAISVQAAIQVRPGLMDFVQRARAQGGKSKQPPGFSTRLNCVSAPCKSSLHCTTRLLHTRSTHWFANGSASISPAR